MKVKSKMDSLLQQQPDFAHYGRLTETTLTEAKWLLASAQLTDAVFNDPHEYDKELEQEMKKVITVILDSIGKQLPAAPLILNTTVFDTPEGEKAYLTDRIYIKIKDFCNWAYSKKYFLPDQLLKLVDSEAETSNAKELEKLPRPSQLARLKCQAIAQTLWYLNPDMKSEEIIRHHAILEFGDGKRYQGKNTLRDWVREVDPRAPETKTGPKKIERETE